MLETSEDKIAPDYLLWYMRNLGAQGILNKINGIIVGKPQDEVYYEEYKQCLHYCIQYTSLRDH